MSNPAIKASEETLKKIFTALDEGGSFRVEAGAGAGKTYSLIEALKHLIKLKSLTLQKSFQKIACITYTNIATEEIRSRIDNHPSVFVDTIHGFCWSILQGFQSQMSELIQTLGDDKLNEKIAEAGGLKKQKVKYDLGYRAATEKEISIHHDTVIQLFTVLLSKEKFRNILKNQYPIIFIDEYQDTNEELGKTIISNLIESNTNIQIGLFGDHWQKIYEKGIGQMVSGKVEEIGKNANFRSEKKIVELLNRMRPNLPQMEKDPTSVGEIKVYHTNNWTGTRRDGKGGGHWTGDLPESQAGNYFRKVKDQLIHEGWEFTPEKTKILMLTNSVLAREQGYANLAKVFRYSDDYLKMQDKYIDFFVNIIEPVSEHFSKKKYGEMLKAIGIRTPRLKNHDDKRNWNESLDKLISTRNTGTIGDVIDCLAETKKPRLSAKIEESEQKFSSLKDLTEFEDEADEKLVSRIKKLKSVQYSEVIELAKYINDKTPFSTNHGVKGAQFENVLVVCGRGWNKYNWSQFLTWENDGVPADKKEAFERNRNLFYVSCSRPKKRLAVLFTQELSGPAMATLNKWFLPENIYSI
ncbi:ATP-dependent helicase [Fulvivirga sp. 29W222]|uniref:DNA 3'-5' helicase II n=1 Tax=Fulvivirga marina TaxID=2494733 RepID=A0A937FZE9_9BACT|nr:UvrD-helicase domain-containing protein [Fulvivirga marina]MBL6448960.1 ATP-dependent helicase [Fulvivirga marina]